MLLQVNVDGMRPVTGEVGQEPVLHAVLLHGEAEGAAIHELAVDRPLPVQAVELEGADDPGRLGSVGQGKECRVRRRVHAVVRNPGTGYPKLQDQIASAGRLNGGLVSVNRDRGATALGGGTVLGSELTIHCRRPLAVDLVQPILQVERLAGKVGEVNDHVHSLGYADPDTVHLNRVRNKIAIRPNQEEWVGRGRTRSADVTGEEEFEEAGWPGVQETEAVAARRNLEEGLDHAVHQELVAQNAIQVEQVKHQGSALGIVDFVGEGQRNIELREAGQMEAGGFIAGITAATSHLAEQAMEPEQAFVSVL